MTLRRILGHVGGFPVHFQYFFDYEPARPSSIADTMRCYGTEIQTPGTLYTYSNLGFEVLCETWRASRDSVLGIFSRAKSTRLCGK